jgi:hypothetical protein
LEVETVDGKALQTAKVLKYMEDKGKITTMDAFTYLGCARLSARIYDLKKAGYKIEKKTCTKKQDGQVKRWAEYRIAGRPGE